MNDIRVSENFKLREFECKDGSHEVMLHSELLERLQSLRTTLGRPLIINSGYRNETHNRAVGGSATSYHMRGMAADIRVPGVSVTQLANAARQAGFRGVISYPDKGFVHVDVRP